MFKILFSVIFIISVFAYYSYEKYELKNISKEISGPNIQIFEVFQDNSNKRVKVVDYKYEVKYTCDYGYTSITKKYYLDNYGLIELEKEVCKEEAYNEYFCISIILLFICILTSLLYLPVN
jgi:hypothetical protein